MVGGLGSRRDDATQSPYEQGTGGGPFVVGVAEQSEPPIASPWAWSFEATCKRWGVEIKREAHGMLADALACWPLWWAIVDRTQELMPAEFEEMLKLQRHFQFRQAFETYADKFQQEN